MMSYVDKVYKCEIWRLCLSANLWIGHFVVYCFVLCFVTKNIRIVAGMITTNGQADRFKIQPMYALTFIAYGYEKEINTK